MDTRSALAGLDPLLDNPYWGFAFTLTLPNGTKPTIDRNFVIANITAPSGLVAEE